MKIAVRKMYISMLTAMLVLVTTIATTYAWFGIDFGHTIGEFELNFDSSSSEGLELSLDGQNFSSYIGSKELKKAVLDKKGISYNDFTLEQEFKKAAALNAATALLDDELKFYDLNGFDNKEDYLSFTFYVRPSYMIGPEDIPEEGIYQSDHAVEVFLGNNEIISSNKVKAPIINTFHHPVFGDLNNVVMNPVNATRFALVKYDSIDKHLEYDSTARGTTTIYDTGGNAYTQDITTNYYNFGGILADEYNLALHDYNSKLNKNLTVPQSAINRGATDTLLDFNRIVSAETDELSSEKIMKFDFYFWYEGWDADCFEAATTAKCSISLNLSTQNPKNIT